MNIGQSQKSDLYGFFYYNGKETIFEDIRAYGQEQALNIFIEEHWEEADGTFQILNNFKI